MNESSPKGITVKSYSFQVRGASDAARKIIETYLEWTKTFIKSISEKEIK